MKATELFWEENSWGRRFRRFLFISVLLHFLFLFGYGWVTGFRFVQSQPPLAKEEREVVFEVVETPNKESEPPPDKANLYSDKNLRAENPEKTEDLADIPFQRGQEQLPTMEQPAPPPAHTQPPAQPEAPSEKKPSEEITREESILSPPKTSFSRDVLLGRSSPQSQPRNVPLTDNRKFSVDDLGGFAFNTYDWNFAPYLLYLKKRIEQHIFPPPAFTRMGIIEGRTVLRFLISRDGQLKDVQILTYEGHVSLMKTSLNAVNSSAPFRPLPGDFPEDFLEVTGTFVYKIYR